MARQVLPAPTGVPLLPDVPNWSWHEYGMRVGVWRFFELYDAARHRADAVDQRPRLRRLRARRGGRRATPAGSSWAMPTSRGRSTRSRTSAA